MKQIKQFFGKYGHHLLFILLSMGCIWFIQGKGEPMMKTTLNGLDAAFHFSRIESLSDIFKSPINFEYFNHIGSMTNIFYPWLMVYPMYLIYALTHNIATSFYLYFMVLTFIGFELTYYCTRKMNFSKVSAILTASLYLFSNCRLSNIYYRVAMGEAVAMTFLPLVLYGCYQIFYAKKTSWIPLTIGMTCIAYSHVITLILASTLVFCFLVIQCFRKQMTKSIFINLLKATGVTILLSSAFLIPMFEIMISTKISPPRIYQLFESALRPQDLLFQSLNNDVGTNNGYGILMLVILMVLITHWKQLCPFFKVSLGLAILFTIMSTKLFPWQLLQPIFMFIQFPWRFVVLGTLMLSFVFGAYLNQLSISKTSLLVGGLSVILLLHASLIQTVMNIDGREFGYNNQAIQTLIQGTNGFNGDRDYIPKAGEDVFDAIRQQSIALNGYWTRPVACDFVKNTASFTVKTDNKGKGALPIYCYKGMTLYQNGKKVVPTADTNGLISITANKGVNHYKVVTHYTLIARIAQIVSLLSFLIFIIGCFIRYRH